jgi:hypothetical protein
MRVTGMESMLLILFFTLLSGLGDAIGFVYAGKVWRASTLT